VDHPLNLFVLAIALLVAPWLLMPVRRSDAEVRGGLQWLWVLNARFCACWYRLKSDGFAPLPEHGPAILISNHTSAIDPMLLQAACRRVLGFMIAKEYFDSWPYRPICRLLRCIPVRRDGRDVSATRAALRALEEGRVVPIFPEGRIVPTSGRTLGEPRPGVAFLVLHARVPVIPAYIWGTPASDGILRAFLTPSRAHVVFGRPIDVADIAPAGKGPIDKATLSAVSERLMGAIHDLRARALGGPGLDDGGIVATNEGPERASRPDGRPGALSGDRPAVPRA
jgi:1-acyl-sn-glycerol-3-phosphate acyltransferase